jgi:hypothetical protein
MANMKKPVAKTSTKKKSDPSNTKPFNVQLIKPSELIRDKPKGTSKPAPKKPAVKRPSVKPAPMPKPKQKAPMKPKPKPTKKYRDATDIPGFQFGRGTE